MHSTQVVAKILRTLDRSLTTLWVGGLWITGYLYAPVLFSSLDERAMAGNIAGILFGTLAWVGLCTVPVLLLLDKFRFGRFHKCRSMTMLLMFLLIFVSQFYLTPQIRSLRESGMTAASEFATLHAVSAVLYLVTSAMGLYLLFIENDDS